MKTRLTTQHPASHYGIPVAVDRQGHAYGPGDLLIQDLAIVEGWVVTEQGGDLSVRA